MAGARVQVSMSFGAGGGRARREYNTCGTQRSGTYVRVYVLDVRKCTVGGWVEGWVWVLEIVARFE